MKIYALLDPRNNAVRYIGVTTQELQTRLAGHVHERKLSTRKGAWIDELYRLDLRPIISEIGETIDEWQVAERRVIASYRAAGHDLLNKSVGGKGRASPHSEETKRKISISKRGQPSAWRNRPARNARISASKKGVRTTPNEVQERALQLFAAGRSKRSISKQLGICRETIRNLVRANEATA